MFRKISKELTCKILQVSQNAYAVCRSVATSICMKCHLPSIWKNRKTLKLLNLKICTEYIFFILNTTLNSVVLILWNFHSEISNFHLWKFSYFKGRQPVLSNVNDSSASQFLLSNKHPWHQKWTHTACFAMCCQLILMLVLTAQCD